MKRWLSHPVFWLVIQPLLLFIYLWLRGALEPQIVPDTASYESIDWSSLRGVLSGIRPFGYPLFLKTASLFGAGYLAVPPLHFLIHCAAVWILYWATRKIGLSTWVSLCAASSLFYSHSVFTLSATVFSDPLAISLSIASAGFVLAVAAQPDSKLNWVALALLTFLVYQIQPAYLFVVALWPLIGIFIARSIVRMDASRLLWFAGGLAITVIGPFLLFCMLRWVVTGHFGLVSFGGFNIVGVAGQLLDQEDVAALPADLQPLAKRIVERRRALELDLASEAPDSFLVMEQMFNPMIWDIAVPAAKMSEMSSTNTVDVNRDLTRLSLAVIKRHPYEYGRWLVSNTKHGLVQIAVLAAKDKAIVTMLIVLLIIHFVSAVRGPISVREPQIPSVTRFRELHVLVWLAIGFALAKLLLVVLVEPANDRYMKGAMVFIPAACASIAAQYLRYVWRY